MNKYYRTQEGKTFIRQADGFDMGEGLWLGNSDSIDNYEEREVEQVTESDYE